MTWRKKWNEMLKNKVLSFKPMCGLWVNVIGSSQQINGKERYSEQLQKSNQNKSYLSLQAFNADQSGLSLKKDAF